MDRRTFIAQAALTASTGAFFNRSAQADRSTDAALLTPTAQAGIDRGLTWLAKKQADDGAFSGTGYSRNVAVCSIAGLAFLSQGSTPGRGAYGGVIQRVLQFVLKHQQENGFLCNPLSTSHGPMYDHGFGTLLLAETYGMTTDTSLRDRLTRAVKLIVSTQNSEGGWRYEPRPIEADISVTISQIMALRAARNAGVYVPNETVERCIDYVKRCQNADGGFMYMLQGGPSRFPRSAAGLVALYSAGIYEGKEVQLAQEYVMRHLPGKDEALRDTHYLYGHYYAAQAMWHAGGDAWAKWYPAIRDTLLHQQSRDGSWQDPIATEYGTAMACIVLQMPNNYLPIFQR